LPIVPAQLVENAVENKHRSPPKYGTVLVVDDEFAFRAMVKRMLAQKGFNFIGAVDGVDGLEKFSKDHTFIDFVLLDITMPKMDGVETYKNMRKICQETPVIICSGYSEDDVVSRFAKDKSLYFLHKPFSLEQLSEKIAAALGL
jgi:two-component system cell cycle sensor histidine kinase/response regulator CckA